MGELSSLSSDDVGGDDAGAKADEWARLCRLLRIEDVTGETTLEDLDLAAAPGMMSTGLVIGLRIQE